MTVPASIALWAFAGLLAATGIMRLAEVVVSVRRMRARPGVAVAEPALFPAMAALHVGLVALPLLEVLLLQRVFSLWVALPALAVLAAASALRFWTLKTIGVAWNVRVVPPREGEIVTTGPYRYVRHPNYLVVILEILALPLLHSAWISAIVLSLGNALVLARRIRTEEAALSQIPAWRDAMSGRARLLPGLF